MPEGIILASASKSASPEETQQNLEKVLAEQVGEENIVRPEVTEPAEDAEPQRDAFDSEEEFEAAHVEWQDSQDAKAEEEEEIEEKPAAGKKPSRMQRKIERATAPLQAQIEELKKKLEGKTEPPPENKVEALKRPSRGDYADTAQGQQEYEDALVKWGVEKTAAENKVKDAADAQKEQLAKNVKSYLAQVEVAKDAHEDWNEVVNQDIPIHKEVQLALLEQENGAEVVYYLGKHPEYAKRLADMSPLSAIMEVGRLSSRLKTGAPRTNGAANGATTQKPKPKVPAPVQPVNSGASSTTVTTKTAKTFKDFAAARRAGR